MRRAARDRCGILKGMKYDKIKPSRHYLKNLKERPGEGHDVPLEDVKQVIDEPIHEEVQPENGRIQFWGQPKDYLHRVRVTVSAAVSASVSVVLRVVTAHLDSGKKFLKKDQD